MNEPRTSKGSKGRTVAIVLALGAAVVIAAAVIVGSLLRSGGDAGPPVMDGARATSIALDFFTGAHGAGATVANLRVRDVTLGPDEHGRSVWKVNISGDVTEAGATFTYYSVMWLYIDPGSGAVRIFAQG